MKYKKIRGHKRRQRAILKWAESESELDTNRLKTNNYEYTEVFVQPWINISVTRSQFPEPTRETKHKIIRGLEAIYERWKSKLENLDQPYYLKIWLYEPRISKSQVVCAIGEKIAQYNKMFHKIDIVSNQPNYFTKLNANFKWELAIDEDIYLESELLWPEEQYIDISDCYADRRFLKWLKKSNCRTETIDRSNGEKDIIFFVPKGKIWIGEK